jgi:cell division topological specificity factor
MRFAGLFGRQRSASTAHHRLQVLLMHERCAGGKPDLIPILREDILAAIGKHVTVDPDKVRLKIERGEMVSLLEIDIEIPTSMKHDQDRFATGVQFPLSWG